MQKAKQFKHKFKIDNPADLDWSKENLLQSKLTLEGELIYRGMKMNIKNSNWWVSLKNYFKFNTFTCLLFKHRIQEYQNFWFKTTLLIT